MKRAWTVCLWLLTAAAGTASLAVQAGQDAPTEPAPAGRPSDAAPPRYPDDPHFGASGAWGQDFGDQWALQQLRVYTDVAPHGPGPGDPVVVAVIDTGLDYTHEDFAADRLWRNPGEQRNSRDDDGNGYRDDLIGWDFADDDNNPWDESGHGTHLAGIIAACTHNGVGIAGVNGQASIMPLKVANFSGQARSSAVAAAIHYAVDNGARVVNLSLGSEVVTELEREAARRATEAGVLIVVAAGNKGLNTSRFGYPSLPGVLVVGATGSADERAGFSNFGTFLDVLAPGIDVLSLRARDTDFIALSDPPDYAPGAAFVGEQQGYYRASGTSFAAALVSGMASRIIAVHPEYSGETVANILKTSAVDLEAPGVDQLTGHGRVDLVRALGTQPGHFTTARLHGVELTLEDQQVWLNFRGSAAGDDFASARLEVRPAPGALPQPGENDNRRMSRRERKAEAERLEVLSTWQPLGEPLTAAVQDGVLGRQELDSLMTLTGGATSWEIRLMVDTGSGEQRESRLRMELPVPEPGAETSGE
jgi:subtilisin family serine protease